MISHTERVLAFYNNTVNKKVKILYRRTDTDKYKFWKKAKKKCLLSYAAFCKERASLFTGKKRRLALKEKTTIVVSGITNVLTHSAV